MKGERIVQLNHEYSTGELAAFFECSHDTIKKYARDGNLKGKKVGGNWFFTGVNVKKFLKQYSNMPHARGWKNY